MENASKALLMAGGTLLAILILTVLIYTLNASNTLAQAQDEKKLAQQTSAFNKEYEAYEKSRMYGTDVITVVNKAIDYNQRLGINDEEYFINIVLDLRGASFNTSRTVTWEKNGVKKDEKNYTDIGLGNDVYQLKTGTGTGTGVNETLKTFFSQTASDDVQSVINPDGTKTTTYTYSGLNAFKRATFTCENVSYSPITGRIDSMTFKQI